MDTSAFYNKNEIKVHERLNYSYVFRTELLKFRDNLKNKNDEYVEELKGKLSRDITNCNKEIENCKKKLYKEFKISKEKGKIRNLNEKYLTRRNIISVFDSALTRTIGLKEDNLYTDIMIVQTYFFDILEDIVLNGYMYNNEKYICLTASAGQIRTKKTVFIKESVWRKHENDLTCGLTLDIINSYGGNNVNKYLAYLALSNSATDEWCNFDIKRSIVVDDFETLVSGVVDFIDDKTYNIERKQMDIPIPHTDGCGMILPKINKKSMMIRLPWVKGLLVPFPFDKFIREKSKETGGYCGKIKDIYGVEHDILEENIQIIFTKSQFKMWKYYNSWEKYIDNFIKYKCQAGYCNKEEDEIPYAKINYQMLQTLIDMKDCELQEISEKTRSSIVNIGKDRKTMLKVLGVTDTNTNKNYLQQALEIYPELLNDVYSKEVLKQVKKSLVKKARAGKLDIDGKYTFICPDLYAFCEYLFLGNKNPDGLLKNGEVFCKIYKDKDKLNCLRSPHLYIEHCVRKNIIDKEKTRWFITKGVYTSCHDLISKIMQFDVDGDKSLVVADETIINVAERNIKDIVPLYYNMATAKAEIISNESIYRGLKTAYTGGNIGIYSNNISKVLNSEYVDLDVIKLLCMENNFVIDFAKTLYKPIRPKEKKKLIDKYTKLKVPHFFKYAKDKADDQIEFINNSVVNRLEKFIPNPRINFKASNLGKFDYKKLMYDKNVLLDEGVIKKYRELDLKKYYMEDNSKKDRATTDSLFLYKDIRTQLLEINSDKKYVTDVLIKYLYENKKSNYKITLWSSFGDVIVDNLKNNIKNSLDDGFILCEICGKRVENTSNNRKYCNDCWKEIRKEQNREKALKYYHKNKNFTT